jgi:hypothetical protein
MIVFMFLHGEGGGRGKRGGGVFWMCGRLAASRKIPYLLVWSACTVNVAICISSV